VWSGHLLIPATASELGRRLSISKQAAGKTVDRLESLGYVERADDPSDGRRKLLRLTPRGIDSLVRSAAIFEDLHDQWGRTLGVNRLAEMEEGLRTVVPSGTFRLDVAGWFSV
jgi:DNA-binding MarR family transcriptional regulator